MWWNELKRRRVMATMSRCGNNKNCGDDEKSLCHLKILIDNHFSYSRLYFLCYFSFDPVLLHISAGIDSSWGMSSCFTIRFTILSDHSLETPWILDTISVYLLKNIWKKLHCSIFSHTSHIVSSCVPPCVCYIVMDTDTCKRKSYGEVNPLVEFKRVWKTS